MSDPQQTAAQQAERPRPSRPNEKWMAVLARADAASLSRACAPGCRAPLHALRRPEAGLVMVRGRTGGGGAPFTLGEWRVTRCSVQQLVFFFASFSVLLPYRFPLSTATERASAASTALQTPNRTENPSKKLGSSKLPPRGTPNRVSTQPQPRADISETQAAVAGHDQGRSSSVLSNWSFFNLTGLRDALL